MARWGVSLTYQMLLASYDCTLVSGGACLVGPRYVGHEMGIEK